MITVVTEDALARLLLATTKCNMRKANHAANHCLPTVHLTQERQNDSTVLQQTQLACHNPHSTSESNYHIQTDITENDQCKDALPRGELLVSDAIPSEHSAEKLSGTETLRIRWFAPMTSGSQNSVGEDYYGVRYMSAEND
ncbi:unnamed protein product [Gongylonema pulchrum]|uniref:Fibronectin type-III domain-containing protein n=1 Tax=Gongylonema pulchrum TaxID=637853 RepID=A0A183DT15_9BILA|nr:unnamed protein product [Gongylonema pulchrum]